MTVVIIIGIIMTMVFGGDAMDFQLFDNLSTLKLLTSVLDLL